MPAQQGFYDYFKDNMDGLGLPAPAELFGQVTTTLATIGTLNALVEKFGLRVTVRELLVAGVRAEKLMVVGAMSASFYTGAVIGSLAVATAREITGVSLSDVLMMANQHRINRPWVQKTLIQNPKLYSRAASAASAAGAASRP